MLDRTLPPAFQNVGEFTIKEANSFQLNNNRDVFYLHHGNQDVFKIEFSIKAGSSYTQDYELVPLTLKMLGESTLRRTGQQMADELDSIGCFIEFNPGFDFSSISIYGLKRHFSKITELAAEIIYEPKLGSNEFTKLKEKESHRLKLSLEKTSYLSSINFRSAIFGLNHPYGRSLSLDKLDSIDILDIRQFFLDSFGEFDILISGSFPKDFKDILNEKFGSKKYKESRKQNFEPTVSSNSDLRLIKDGSIQASIKIGKKLFNRSHPDYIKLMVTNELLGGFFGSRLMKNIREEKGITYGIYSHVYALNEDGYFAISTDVNDSLVDLAVEEVFKEIKQLQTVEVSGSELNTVKNYMLGSLSSSISSPFSLMDRFKAVHYQGLGYEYYKSYFQTLSSISPKDLMEQSIKHLNTNSLTTCIVGP